MSQNLNVTKLLVKKHMFSKKYNIAIIAKLLYIALHKPGMDYFPIPACPVTILFITYGPGDTWLK